MWWPWAKVENNTCILGPSDPSIYICFLSNGGGGHRGTSEFFYKAFTSPFVLYSNSALKRNEKICYPEFVITVWSHKVHFNRGLSLKLKEILKMNGIYVYTFLGSGSYRHFLLPPEFWVRFFSPTSSWEYLASHSDLKAVVLSALDSS